MTGLLQRIASNTARKVLSTKPHESDTKSLVRVSRSSEPSTSAPPIPLFPLLHLFLYSLCTSAPTVLRPRKVTNRTRKVYPRNRHEKFIHESTRIRHEKACPRISRICTSAPLFPLHLYSLCTSAPTVLRPRKGANPARKACLATSVFYTLLINIGSIVPGAPAALGIGAASFDGEGGDVDGKDTAESPTA